MTPGDWIEDTREGLVVRRPPDTDPDTWANLRKTITQRLDDLVDQVRAERPHGAHHGAPSD